MSKRKSRVESAFQRWDDEVLKSLPGYGCGQRGQSESACGPATAVCTLLPLRRLTVDWIIRYNTSHVLNQYPLTRHMVQDGVQPIPIKLWHWGVHNGGPVVIPDPTGTRLALLPAGTATRIQDHIWFQGVEYACDGRATGDGAAEPEAPQAVAVRYNPGRMGVLFLVRKGALR